MSAPSPKGSRAGFLAVVCSLGAIAIGLVITGAVLANTSDSNSAETAALTPSGDGGPVPSSSATSLPSTTTTEAKSDSPALIPDLPPGFDRQPVDDNASESALYGWGTIQPNQMRATVHYGGSSTRLTPERRDLLAAQLVEAREAALAIGTVAEAERQGFVKNYERVDGRGFDYINWDRFTTELDLSKPSLLLFPDDQPDSKIISVAYNVLGPVADGPPTDLPLEVIPWHYHSNLCQTEETFVGSVEYDAEGKPYQAQIDRCLELGATFRPELNHWMVDLWVIPGWENPWGLVSSYHPDMYDEPTAWFPFENDEVDPDLVEAEGIAFCQIPDPAGSGDAASS